jgi:hypothetical protein
MRRQADQLEKPVRTKTLIFKRPERSVGGPLSAILERLNARKAFNQRAVIVPRPEAFDFDALRTN